MSEENVELMRQAVEAWNRGDLDGWARDFADDVAWYPLAENPENAPVHGKEAVLDFVRDWIEPWEEYTVEAHRIIDAGDYVVMSSRQIGRDETGTEVTIEQHATSLVRDGKVVEMKWFLDEGSALKAAGISE